MEVKELMIGDWVYIFDPDNKEDKEVYQVSEVREGGIRTRMFTDTYEEGWFEPIPLTEEILKANGLYDCGEFYDGWNFDLAYKKKIVSVGCIWFVHELQHTLRLCGLNELADNFKLIE